MLNRRQLTRRSRAKALVLRRRGLEMRFCRMHPRVDYDFWQRTAASVRPTLEWKRKKTEAEGRKRGREAGAEKKGEKQRMRSVISRADS